MLTLNIYLQPNSYFLLSAFFKNLSRPYFLRYIIQLIKAYFFLFYLNPFLLIVYIWVNYILRYLRLSLLDFVASFISSVYFSRVYSFA